MTRSSQTVRSRVRHAGKQISNRLVVDNPLVNNRVTNNPVTRTLASAVSVLANDQTLQQFFAHGLNELANVLVKGHAAPIYTRSMGPSASQQDRGPPKVGDTSTVHGPNEPSQSNRTTIHMHAPEPTPDTPEVEVNDSILDSLMQDIGHAPDVEGPELQGPEVEAPSEQEVEP